MNERIEALLRIPLIFVYGAILCLLGLMVGALWFAMIIYTLLLGKRHRELANFMNGYAALTYRIYRYLLFATNEHPELTLNPLEPCDFETVPSSYV
jgi:hypothetical protein